MAAESPDSQFDMLTESLFAEEFRLDQPAAEEKAKNRRDFQDMMLGRRRMPAATPMDLPAAIAILNARKHRGYSHWRQAELDNGPAVPRQTIVLAEDPGATFPQAWWLTDFEAIAVATHYEEEK